MVAITLSLVGCSSDDSVAANNPEINECLGTTVPFPAQASITTCITLDIGIAVVFDPGISWEESIAFFSNNYNSGDWTITRHEIFGENTSEREAEWSISGPDFTVELLITAFGDNDFGFTVGSYNIYY